jgi:hypothetical protein
MLFLMVERQTHVKPAAKLTESTVSASQVAAEKCQETLGVPPAFLLMKLPELLRSNGSSGDSQVLSCPQPSQHPMPVHFHLS